MMKRALVMVVMCLLGAAYGAITGALGNDGACVFTADGRPLATATAEYFLPGWSGRSFPPMEGEMVGNRMESLGGKPGDRGRIRMAMTWKQVDARRMSFAYAFTPVAEMSANAVFASLVMPATDYVGRGYYVDGQRKGAIASGMPSSARLFHGKARAFGLDSPHGRLTLTFAEPQEILFQDDRRWGVTLTLRVLADPGASKTWRKDVDYKVSYLLTLPETVTVSVNRPVTLTAGEDWIPLEVRSLEIVPGSALDFTQVMKLDAPAGKHGYLKAVGPNFEFEGKPGEPQRFYGVNFCYACQAIPPEQSKVLAVRLARLGYNAVRYHHYESTLCRPDIPGDSTQLNPPKMACFDAMFAAIKAQGLYATTDLYVSRKVYESEVYEGGSAKRRIDQNTYKFLCAFSPRARQNWKKFSRHLLTHVNPHTGLSYAQDPSLSLISLVNEGTMRTDRILQACNRDPRFKAVVLNAWNDWQRKHNGPTAGRRKNLKLRGKDTLDFEIFLTDSEVGMIREFKGFLREELGCRALISNTNFLGKHVRGALTRAELDYADDHFYVDHPLFVKRPWRLPSRCRNSSVVKTGRLGGSEAMFARLVDRPFTITEWNYSAPGRYRGVGGILTGCMASIQDWSGLWRFAYSHGSSMFEPLGMRYFDLKSDPLNQAADRASILLYLRRDLGSATHAITASIDRRHLQDKRNGDNRPLIPSWNSLGMLCKLGIYVGDSKDKVPASDFSVSYSAGAPRGRQSFTDHAQATGEECSQWLLNRMQAKGWIPEGNRTDLKRNVFQTFDGQFTMDAPADTMILNTPRTAGGFAPAGTTVKTASMDVTMLDTDATVWVSSLSQEPIATSKRLLLTHLTDLQNTGMRYNEPARKILLDWGRLPYLVRRGRAEVMLKLKHPDRATVWAIDTCGKRLRQYPSQVTRDGLKLMLSVDGGKNAQLMYEIVVE